MWGCLGTAEAGGFRRHRLGTSSLITLHYSLKTPFPFPHGFVLWESASCRIPQSKIKDFCQLPLTREPCGESPLTISHDGFLRIVLSLTRPVSLLRCSRCIGQSPPCQRGVPRHRRGGGIPQAGKFPHRLVLLESASCESLSHGCAVPAPFGKGAFLRPVSLPCRRVPPIPPNRREVWGVHIRKKEEKLRFLGFFLLLFRFISL